MQAEQAIYLNKIAESVARLGAAQQFLTTFRSSGSVPHVEAAILQVRKAFEATAYAAIAPNKPEYEKFRSQAEKQPDYRKDFNARTILQALARVNADFYPIALLPAAKKVDGTFHFERKASGFLSKDRFESFYDRLGAHLHADNPWGSNKNLQNIATELPTAIDELFQLIELHCALVQTSSFSGTWVVEVPRGTSPPRIIVGAAAGPFVVEG